MLDGKLKMMLFEFLNFVSGSSTDVAKGFLQLNPLGKKSDLKPTSASSVSW